MMFFLDERGQAGTPTASYWGARMLAQEWVKPGDEAHELFPAASDLKNRKANRSSLLMHCIDRMDFGRCC
jgi:hypothetical protein